MKRLLEDNHAVIDEIIMGEARVSYDPDQLDLDRISELLEKEGFELIKDKDEQLVE
jgi:hypothetical protein